MKLINNISINLVELPEAGGLKRFKILGDDGAKFIIIVSCYSNQLIFWCFINFYRCLVKENGVWNS